MTDVDCPSCDYWHALDEPCLFDACTGCGGVFYGPTRAALCGTCVEGERRPVQWVGEAW